MKYKLKPCPFCGGKAEFQTNDWVNVCWVECKNCKAKIPAVPSSCDYTAKERAMENWNIRVST